MQGESPLQPPEEKGRITRRTNSLALPPQPAEPPRPTGLNVTKRSESVQDLCQSSYPAPEGGLHIRSYLVLRVVLRVSIANIAWHFLQPLGERECRKVIGDPTDCPPSVFVDAGTLWSRQVLRHARFQEIEFFLSRWYTTSPLTMVISTPTFDSRCGGT